MVVTTPSGYKVTIKDYITFGQRREIERILISASKLNAETKQMVDISPTTFYDAQDKAVDMMVTEIVKGDTVITSGFVKEISEWKEGDGQVVYDAINKITTPQKQEGEKK